jgi:CheY-like chemotaxis protein
MKDSVLCVDDDLHMLTVMDEVLRHYKVKLATSGEEGIEVLTQAARDGVEYKVVVSDYNMRRDQMNGVEFLTRVHEVYSDICLLLFSAAPPEESNVFYEVLVKPARLNKIQSTVDKLVMRYDAKKNDRK